jgi:tetratricopeptide (TPR) repeat protein
MSAESIDALLAEASRLYNDGSYVQAIRKWEEVLALDPENQKARESIKIASLLSDSWAEGPAAPDAPEAAAPPSEEEQRLQERMGQVRDLIAARDFHAAMKECETLAAAAPDNSDIKALTDQARSGLESEPFVRAAVERAGRELKAGKFEMVEVLCRKILSLDATNREARTYLYMAQRRSAGEVGEVEAPTPEELVQESPPDPATEPEPTADPRFEPPVEVPGEPAPLEVPDDPPPPPAADFGEDISPDDLAGVGGAPNPAGGAVPSGEPGSEGEFAQPPEYGAQTYEAQRGEEVDASQIESIPLGAPRPEPATHTHTGAELVQEGSIYSGPEPGSEEGAAAPAGAAPAAASSPPAPEIGDLHRPASPRKADSPPAAHAHAESEPPARPQRAPRPARPQAARVAPAPAAGSSGWLKAAAVLLLLIGGSAGAAFWWMRRSAPPQQEVAPNPLQRTQKPNLAPAAGPAALAADGARPQADGAAPATAPPSEAAAAPSPAAEPEAVKVEPTRPAVPTDPVALQNLALKRLAEGKALMRQNKLEEARAALSEALEYDPVLFEARDKLEEVERGIQEGARFGEDVRTIVSSFEGGDYHSALWKMYRMQEAFPEIRSWDLNMAASWYNWGVKLLKAGNSRDALEKFDEALKINPHDREAIRQKTVAERYQSRPRDASFNAYVDGLTLRPLVPIRR